MLGEKKTHNEWLFHSDGLAYLCFFMILTLSLHRLSRKTPHLWPHLSERQASDKDLITALALAPEIEQLL